MSEEVEIVKNEVIGGIDASSYPLELSKVLQIQQSFVPKWEEKTELERDIEAFRAKYEKEGHNEETVEEAKTLAKRAMKVRTSTDKIHKIEKSFYWEGGKLVDEFRKAIRNPVEEYEAELKEVTEKEKREEEERLAKLQEERVAILSEYVEDAEERKLNEMDDEMWETYLMMQKKKYEDRVAEEKKAEEEEKERQRLVVLHNSRKEELIPYWNFLEGEQKESNFSELSDEEFKTIKKDVQALKAQDDEKKAKLEKEAAELRKKEAKRKERGAEMNKYISHIANYDKMIEMPDDKYAKALKDAKKLYEEAEKKRVEEEKVKEKEEADRLAQIEADKKAKSAPDKEKLQKLAKEINGIEFPELSSDEAKEILEDVTTLLGKVTKYINEEVENL